MTLAQANFPLAQLKIHSHWWAGKRYFPWLLIKILQQPISIGVFNGLALNKQEASI